MNEERRKKKGNMNEERRKKKGTWSCRKGCGR